jgi:hypothetical protein
LGTDTDDGHQLRAGGPQRSDRGVTGGSQLIEFTGRAGGEVGHQQRRAGADGGGDEGHVRNGIGCLYPVRTALGAVKRSRFGSGRSTRTGADL